MTEKVSFQINSLNEKIDKNIQELDSYINSYIDDLYSSNGTLSKSDQYTKDVSYEPEFAACRTFTINKESDRIYDNFKDRNSTLEYKRYGQFLSIAEDSDPNNKQIIDIFDLYKILKYKKMMKNDNYRSMYEVNREESRSSKLLRKVKSFFKK